MSNYPPVHSEKGYTTHTTTTTGRTTTFGAEPSDRAHFDGSYFKSIPGILRIVEIVLLILLFICAVVACGTVDGSFGACGWGAFVAFVGFIVVILWLLFYLFHVQDSFPNVPWLLIELVFYAVWAIFLLATGISLAVEAKRAETLKSKYSAVSTVHSASGAGSFFALVTFIVFAVQTFLIFRSWREHRSLAAARDPIGGHP